MTIIIETTGEELRGSEVHCLGQHRIKIEAIKCAESDCYKIVWFLWQYGWRQVDDWGTKTTYNSCIEAINSWREGILQEAIKFVDGLTNEGPG